MVKVFVRLHGGALSIEKYSDEKAMTDVFFKRLQVQLIQKIEGIFKWIFFKIAELWELSNMFMSIHVSFSHC